MPVESAADRTALFNTDEFAEAATYTPPTPPGGAAVACQIIYDRGQGAAAFGREAEARGPDRRAFVNADQVASVKRNGTFVVGAETLKVAGVPQLDETGKIWSLELVLQ